MNKVIFLLLLSVVVYSQTQTGVKSSISLNGINYFKDVGMPILEQKLSNLSIPEITHEADTPIGHINITLTNIAVSDLQIGTANISLSAPDDIILTIINIEATVTLDWYYGDQSHPILSDHGSANVSVSQTNTQIELGLAQAGGKPAVNVTSCTVEIGQLDIEVQGGASWIYQLFIDVFSKIIQNAVEDELEQQLPSIIDNGVASAVKSLPIVVKINDDIEVNYELSADPTVVGTEFIVISALGEFTAVSDPKDDPFVPAPLPNTATDQMLQIFVSEFTVNSASFVFFSEGLMQYYVNDSMLPANSPLRLNTTYFTDLIPPLEKSFPDQMFELRCYAADTPTVTFATSGAIFNALVNIDVIILPKLDLAFTLQLKVLGDADAQVKGNNIAGSVSYLNATLSIEATNIGNFSLLALQEIVGTLVEQVLIPQANKKLAVGFPLPTIDGLSFDNPTIGWGDHYLYVSSDVTYKPNFTSIITGGNKNVPISIA